MITYDEYPLLLHTSFTQKDAPDELPFEVVSTSVQNYLSNCNGYKEMFALIAIKNSLEKENSNTHYWLNNNLFNKVDSDDYFRNTNFRNFFGIYLKSQNGTILFKDGGQYLYMLCDVKETKNIKNKDGRYIAVALFRKNFFIGFEEGYISERGIQIAETGHYENNMPIGGYISFVLITLGYANNRELSLLESPTKEKIYCL